MRSMLILEGTLEMFATTVQVQLNATLHVCESGLQAYAKKPRTIQKLENNIRREIAAISEDVL